MDTRDMLLAIARELDLHFEPFSSDVERLQIVCAAIRKLKAEYEKDEVLLRASQGYTYEECW